MTDCEGFSFQEKIPSRPDVIVDFLTPSSRRHPPDLVLVQIRHSSESGLGVVGQFHQPEKLAYPRSVDAKLVFKLSFGMGLSANFFRLCPYSWLRQRTGSSHLKWINLRGAGQVSVPNPRALSG